MSVKDCVTTLRADQEQDMIYSSKIKDAQIRLRESPSAGIQRLVQTLVCGDKSASNNQFRSDRTLL